MREKILSPAEVQNSEVGDTLCAEDERLDRTCTALDGSGLLKYFKKATEEDHLA